MNPTELPVLTPADELELTPMVSPGMPFYYVFCNEEEKAVYVRKSAQCPAEKLEVNCGCRRLFRLQGESTGDHTTPFEFRNIGTIPDVDDIVATCEGEYVKVMSIEWL